MGNKTIYVRDNELWARAKELAGKEGLSSIIGAAVEDFVRRREAEEKGFQQFRVNIEAPLGDADGMGLVEQIAFNGKKVGAVDLEPCAAGRCTIYVTKGGKFIGCFEDQLFLYNYVTDYRVFDTLAELKKSEWFACLSTADWVNLNNKISSALGDGDWATWIE